jgi:hypothetical protein
MTSPAFRTPWEIQSFLNSIPYNPKEECKSPKRVFEERTAHCFEGALFAASRLRALGHPPLLMDLSGMVRRRSRVSDAFKSDGCWGPWRIRTSRRFGTGRPSIGRFGSWRCPYSTSYFNTIGQKTLRAYSSPLNSRNSTNADGATSDGDLEYIGDSFAKLAYHPLLSEAQSAALSTWTRRCFTRGSRIEHRRGSIARKNERGGLSSFFSIDRTIAHLYYGDIRSAHSGREGRVNINKAIDKAYEAMGFKELASATVDAIAA